MLSGIRFVRSLVDTEVLVGQRVVLSCETSDDVASVDWLKNDEHLSRDSGCHGYEMLDSGRVHSLTILTVSLDDEAKYTCSCRDDVTSCLVLVEGRIITIKHHCFHKYANTSYRKIRYYMFVNPMNSEEPWNSETATNAHSFPALTF